MYKKIKPYLEYFDNFVGETSGCGLFKPGIEENNGYGCRSTSKDKEEEGLCYRFACPLCSTVSSLTQLWEYDIDEFVWWYEYIESKGDNVMDFVDTEEGECEKDLESEYNCELVIVYREKSGGRKCRN